MPFRTRTSRVVQLVGHQRWQTIVAVIVAGQLVITGGCGGSGTLNISGQVVYSGNLQPAKELVGYIVTFEPLQEGTSATGVIDSNGRFTLSTFKVGDGVTVGAYQVAITPPRPVFDEPPPEPLIDERYFRPATSGIKISVNGETNHVQLVVAADAAL